MHAVLIRQSRCGSLCLTFLANTSVKDNREERHHIAPALTPVRELLAIFVFINNRGLD
jgi:hypothetical protein